MSITVTADATVTLNVTDADTSGTAAAGGDVTQLQETLFTGYGASPLHAVTKSWSANLTLAAAPTTLDLTALTGPRGSTVAFASVRLFYVLVTDATPGHSVGVGNAAADAWSAPLDAATDTYTVPANSRAFWENNDTTPWAVDGTHKNLMLDPGAATVTCRVVIVGG